MALVEREPGVWTHSIGNQIPEDGSPVGTARHIANAVNTMLAAITKPGSLRAGTEARDGKEINTLMADARDATNAIADLAARRAAETSLLDTPRRWSQTGPRLAAPAGT